MLAIGLYCHYCMLLYGEEGATEVATEFSSEN